MWLAEAPFDEGLGVPSAVKRVAEALGISEMAVDAQRKRLAEPEKAASDLERGAPVPSLRLSPPTELVARDGEQMLQVVRAIVREFAPLAEEATQALHRIDARLGQLAGGESEEL